MNLFANVQSILLAITNSDDFVNLLQFPFMQRAMIGAVLMGILGGLLGCFVTLRQLSFFSHAVGHAALVGVALGVLLNTNPTWMLLPFTLVFGVIVLYLIDKTDLASDSVLSIVLSGALAIGVILTSMIKGYRGNLMAVLFGDILAIDTTDLILTLVILLGSGIFILSTLRSQILLTLNPNVAQVQGVPVQLYRYGFVVLLSLAVAVAIKAVGVLLVNAFLVIPASTAKLMSHHFSRFLILSVIVGSSSSIVGIMVSGVFNLASGPSIVLVQFLVFVIVFSWVKLGIKTA
ncbi:metal ABC transporter permease [Anabaena cylindrica FACHB-243]|uniref:ABC-type transporter, integral membrane subunit n=1 Tax=Anabaena cylindrica (strain ATCC 27899 / PCC 7122) TaxID=272123 RepID=K9ZCG9_ANACC|nr:MULTISPECIES: metal ABC transporter permease [Anabaena]AFZ56918.1 ABC-type transporter, integral membrane subunit [Anabaena cylindrica PCC 7122]MBD2418416.1 metal ABC transporter permease [Anabaena cylindrica FACHB-243]MBY5284363.1 metal ABC transporter permease [Anabaena sp. CCAP 1446/1C]MBY5307638.1 metal ABC transporter permease [Anabaena sp. CCAP 1446/1C]MCM2409401.1 metal ABC transporter permease [Anabaena sp. CCAP 1446/1C]